MRIFYLLILVLFISLQALYCKPLILSTHELSSPPPRIIRTCCSFGSNVKIMAVPFITVTDITSINELGPHTYLGNPKEGNGIIYTHRGGFIDIGHLRDQADWTAYIYALITKNLSSGIIYKDLGHEGGDKTLHINMPPDADSMDAILLAGRIAYDLSVWHEIATWFGVSYIPMIPERYSSFSPEDPYSNLLGVVLGIEAIKSDLPFEQAMTVLISKKLIELGCVKNREETYLAMEAVRNLWWTREKYLPGGKVIMKRELNVYNSVSPLLVPGWGNDLLKPYALNVPDKTISGKQLSDYYQLEFKLNLKFPYRKLFPEENGRIITSRDFHTLINYIEKDWLFKETRSNQGIKPFNHDLKRERKLLLKLKQKNIS